MANEDTLRRLTDTNEGWADAFGEQVAKNTRNAIDLPAFYDFSEERYRFIENGTRIRNPDVDSTRFSDQDQQFLIEPQSGDTLEFKTAEAPRYVVGNDADVSWSFKFPSPLVDANDSFTLFVEGSFEIEYTGDGTVTFRSLEGGVEKQSVNVETPNGLDSPSRPELEFNWYAVGRAEVSIDYTDDNKQKTTTPATLTVDDDWLSDDPTGRVGFRLDVSNGGIQLEAGSIAYIVKSGTPPTSRAKPHVFSSSELNQIPADGYGVVGAFRIDPNRDNVFTTINNVVVTSEQSVDVELNLKAVPASATDADFLDPDDDGTDEGPAYPRSNSPQNSVIQWTPNVSTFPTRTYAVDGSTIPNGRSVGAAVETSAGVGAGTQKTGETFVQKRPIYPDDVVLMIGNTPDASTAADVDIILGSDQDW
ncbi:hypothetical protein HFTV1-gp20 [Haloferax tailed virus 1]|uniref:Uncharacterized protein n=1 Tax=Haloferax tailed virus 1 TaxID=2507575 RepID=A0A410N6U5_HFTV1|nr:hypothetical protein M1M17_gp20 [Haloferax tailed virus 1]QAS68853.1 hypothetical protein HFTV1-gp20 [Haloferax tailed virus 1]